MSGLGRAYVVQPGDSLCGIARRYLGHEKYAAQLFTHNNRPEVVALSRSRILRPGLIFVGQTLYLPELSTKNNVRIAASPLVGPPAPQSVSKTALNRYTSPNQTAFTQIRLPALRVDLAKYRIVFEDAAFRYTLQYKINLTLQDSRLVDFISVSRDAGISLQNKQKLTNTLQSLTSISNIEFNPISNKLAVKVAFATHAQPSYLPSTEISGGMSNTGGAKISVSLKLPPLRGTIDSVHYATSQGTMEISIERKDKPLSLTGAEKVLLYVGAGVVIFWVTVDNLIPVIGWIDDVPGYALATAMLALASSSHNH